MPKFIADILPDLIDLSRWSQLDYKRESLISNSAWLDTICTIKLAGPRGSGHTYAAAKVPQQIAPKHTLIIGINPLHVKWIKKELDSSLPVTVKDINEFWRDGNTDNLGAIVVDTAGQISNAELKRVRTFAIEKISEPGVFFLIILG